MVTPALEATDRIAFAAEPTVATMALSLGLSHKPLKSSSNRITTATRAVPAMRGDNASRTRDEPLRHAPTDPTQTVGTMLSIVRDASTSNAESRDDQIH